jgi:ATP-independent RNA helicase DbpA
VLTITGGEPFGPQRNALERGVHVVVGTPGRLLEHLERGTISLLEVTTLVLDEADKMLDMGFKVDVERILTKTPEERQTVLFSATLAAPISALSQTHQRDAVSIGVAEPQSPSDIRQVGVAVEPEAKLAALCWVLAKYPHDSALIFCHLKSTVKDVARALDELGGSADCLHGDLEQLERERVMARFKNESLRWLVATDVAARGIDVEDLDLVVNHDLPTGHDTYVHRIGRTGRAGKAGLAVSLVSVRERVRVSRIEAFTGQSFEPVEFGSKAPPRLPPQLVRAAKMATLRIGAGGKDKLRPGDILGALTGEAGGLHAKDVGKIEIHDRHSYVAVSTQLSATALESLGDGRIPGRRFPVSLLKARGDGP